MQFFSRITEFMTQTLSIFYTLLMITFLSMTQSYTSNITHLMTHDIFPCTKMPYTYTPYDTGHFSKKITPDLRCLR